MKKSIFFLGLIILTFLLSISFISTAFAQNKGAWVEYKLPGDRPANWSQGVGENCLIFMDRNAPEIYAFDISSAAWHTYTAATDLSWLTNPEMGRNVGFVYNDEMAVAYSGLTQTFVPITYSGTLLGNTTYGHGCTADMAYFVTDQYLYIFDGEDAVWRTYDISDMGDVISWGMYGIEDYIFLYANEADDFKKIVAFSYLTKTFAEYDGDGFIEHEELNHGFIFYKNTTPAADSISHFFAGYSAFSGSYVLLERAYSSAIWNSMARSGHPGTSAMFEDRYRIEDNNWKIDIFGFDTRHGNFVQTGYNYDYVCQHGIQPYIMAAGSNIAVNSYRDCDTDELTYIVYKGSSNSFQTALEEGLYYPTCVADANPQCGGDVLGASDCEYMWFFDAESWLGSKVALPAITDGYTNPAPQRMYGTWSIGECKRALDSTVHIYSYNQDNSDGIHTFNFESARTHGRFDSTNVGGRLSNNVGGPNVLYLYSPGIDSWTSVDFGSSAASVGKGTQRDFVYWFDFGSSGPMNIFDGVTGITTTIPYGWSYNYAARLYTRSNFMLTHSTDDRYTGYSTYTRTSSEYATPYMSSPRGQEDVLVIQKPISGGGADILAYNVLYDNFVMTNLGTEYGTYFDIAAGGKTALIMTLPGHLLAWDPNADAATDVDDELSDTNLPGKYSLSQNYPNPFNPSTIISYSIPKQSDVTISIINLLGQKVKTIINENQETGEYEINWDGTDQSGKAVASGIYFYQINTGDYTASKKMIMIK
ncbi:MAG: T9SS type A sorting domain-containing protein [candidate division Zixibacteria bacterium]|nr:T9SS type A sorting domain-containing protein [candidate division Zixibacteria bacterium]